MSGNSRVVKRLLVKGACKNAKDNKGLTAADIAKENEFLNIFRMLTEENSCLVEYYNVKPGFRKAERSRRQLVKFAVMYVFVLIISILIQNQEMEEKWSTLFYFFVSAQIVFALFFFLLWNSDPGFLGKKGTPFPYNRILDFRDKNQLMGLLK
jgi:palmitoyltransferase